MANFVSNDNATSLMNAINQKKDSKPSTITWAEWIALTDEQREGTHYIITNVPAKFSDKDAVFSIKDQTLTFTNKTATVTDSRITADTYIFTFYHNQAVAQAAGIECSWTTGTVTFTVDENPSDNIVVDILCILPALATPPSEGGGHVIEDASGTDLPQQDTMQFADARVEDDTTNGKTVVHVTQEPMTVEEFNEASDLDPGIYPLNGGGEALDDSMIMHDSTHTTRQAINKLSNDVTSVESAINNSGKERTYYGIAINDHEFVVLLSPYEIGRGTPASINVSRIVECAVGGRNYSSHYFDENGLTIVVASNNLTVGHLIRMKSTITW